MRKRRDRGWRIEDAGDEGERIDVEEMDGSKEGQRMEGKWMERERKKGSGCMEGEEGRVVVVRMEKRRWRRRGWRGRQ